MMMPSYHVLGKEEQRLQAVLALFRGEKASDVSASFGICRSDLYKFRGRALMAMREALKDHPRGPKRPSNRLSDEREQRVIASCERHPTRSSYQVMEKLGSDAPRARTIQRVRKRNGMGSRPETNPAFKAGATHTRAGHRACPVSPHTEAAPGARARGVGCAEWRAAGNQPLDSEAAQAPDARCSPSRAPATASTRVALL
jgi:hypothetical protein